MPDAETKPAAAGRPPGQAKTRRRVLCHLCCVSLGRDDREHYGYQCHACVIREHDLVLMLAQDPDHPDAGWLELSPVEIGSPKSSG